MAKRIYIKGVRHKTVDADRLAIAYLVLARILVAQEELSEGKSQPKAPKPEEAK
jgi:hypothetical protein